MRLGFGAAHVVRPPLIDRQKATVEVHALCARKHRGGSPPSMLLVSAPRGGITRFLEETTANLPDQLDGSWRTTVIDLTNRSTWGILDFTVDLRNQFVASIDEKDIRNLPDYNFRGFDYLATLYWVVCANCEGNEPSFTASKYAKLYMKIGKIGTTVLSGGLIEAVSSATQVAEVAWEVGAEAAKIASERRVSNAIRKLRASKLPIGDGPAHQIRNRLRKEEDLNSSDIEEALLDELHQGISYTLRHRTDIRLFTALDAVDILEDELLFSFGSDFARSFHIMSKNVSSIGSVRMIAGLRDHAEKTISTFQSLGWSIQNFHPIAVTDLRKTLKCGGHRFSDEEIEKIVQEATDINDSDFVDLGRYADIWYRFVKEPRNGTS